LLFFVDEGITLLLTSHGRYVSGLATRSVLSHWLLPSPPLHIADAKKVLSKKTMLAFDRIRLIICVGGTYSSQKSDFILLGERCFGIEADLGLQKMCT